MRQTVFDVDEKTGRVELGVKVDTRDTDYLNARTRSEIGKGFTPGRTLRAVADIPYDFLLSLSMSGDADGMILFDSSSDPAQKRRALRGLLSKYPEFRISDGSI